MTVPSQIPLPRQARARTVTAVLGPTNTGKTHLAIERMLGHSSGLIGLPLRLLAREVYGRVVARVGADQVALVTGEEKILPDNPRYYISTVEAMPQTTDVDFVAIDEVQLASDLERGRVFTDRILRLRGHSETLLLGAATARPILERLLPGLNVVTRPRMSVLRYSGSKKITRLPTRSAVVAFSSAEVYQIAELIRRQRGGAAVVLGALSPRTRNAQVELFQSGDVDFLIATDAIGMGLNLDVDHVAFAADRKFDGYQYRRLNPGELGQIAGRAGRHMRDGTFGVTGRVDPFGDDLVEALETHSFEPIKLFQWRNPDLDFSSISALRQALDAPPQEQGLTRAPTSEDIICLEHAAKDPEISGLARGPAAVERLWEVCQLPDYRRIAPANHADLVLGLYRNLMQEGRVPDDWFSRQLAFADRTDGDIDTLSNRIAHIRTWTYVANRADWLDDPAHWRGITRAIEDRLSDALHERLTQRFVDRRTSVLMRRLRDNDMLESEITASGDVMVEGHHVGNLHGFRFVPVSTAETPDLKAVRGAAQKALASEFEKRAERLGSAPDAAFVLASDGAVRWHGEAVAKLVPGEETLSPGLVVLSDDQLSGPALEKVQTRLQLWLKAQIETQLKPLFDLRAAEGLEGIARGLAFQISEALGVLDRQRVADDVKSLDQQARAGMRQLGVRFGAYHIYVPALLKPAPSRLLAELWALKHATFDVPGLAELPQLSASGRTSIPVDPEIPKDLYGVVGFRVCGNRAVRVDILERLADQIRPLIAWKPSGDATTPPEGAIPEGGGFTVTVSMMSLLGCSGEDFASVLKSLGYRVERRPAPPQPVEPVEPAADAGGTGASATPDSSVSETSETVSEAPALSETEAEAPAASEDTPAPDIAASSAEENVPEPATDEVAGSGANEAAAAQPAPPEVLTEVGAEAPATEEPAAAADADVSSEAEPATPSADVADATPEASAEPAMIEVWRPGRRRRPEHHRDRRSEGQGEGPRRGRGGPRRGDQKGQGAGQDQAGGAQARTGGGPDRKRGGEKSHYPGKGGGKRPNQQAKGGGNKPPQRGSGPPEREKKADPDSPFAKLAELKRNMERDKGGRG
ncbi:helicase-related protein [Amorphus orientalis]|uniref:ATP-dependent RNA helicase SUPV3L1/SUV3 n=1 Tax=Amorphus orientalis TaxID=649198 RepID=A0AAE4AR48_9HYPH|nr:helicase-related protein [Amorphus orientalis]MDQ0313812.1 ATP-dependent RNA helicase SUPV3L1/SUV3 [Amorphus orientalis]